MNRPTVDRPPPAAAPLLGRGAWLAAAVGTLCFLNSLRNDFVYDDIPIVRDNPRTHSVASMREIWLSDWWQPPDVELDVASRHRDRLYRPLTLHSFALNYAVGGLSPVGYHALNILLHAAAVLLVWRLTQRLFDDVDVANITALVFAVHPIHCEAVANVVGRAEILATLLMLLGLLVLLPRDGIPGAKRALPAAALFLGALFCKETAVCYVPVALIALYIAAQKPQDKTGRWWLMHAAIMVAPLALYLPLRYVALDHHLLRDQSPAVLANALVWADVPHRLLHAFTILGHYARLMITPAELCSNYGLAVIDPAGGPNLMTGVGVLAALATLAALVGLNRSAPWRQVAALTAIAIASYVLISNSLLLIGVTLGERLMYWPSVPILMAISAILVHGWRRAAKSVRLSANKPKLLRAGGLLLLCALGLRSVVRNADWQSNRTLFERDVQTCPSSAELNEAWASELLLQVRDAKRRDDIRPLLDQADRHLEAALRIYPHFQQALQLRGRVRGMLGDREQAMAYLEAASQLGPLDGTARELLGRLRDQTGEEVSRLTGLAEAVTTRPADADLRLEYGRLLLERGQDREALAELQEAVKLTPENAEALRLLGDAYVARNERASAVEVYQRALAANPADWHVHANLVPLLVDRDPAGALRHAQEAHRLAPNELVTNLHLAEALVFNKRTAEALEILRGVARRLPADDPYRAAVERRISDLERGRP